MWTAETVNGNRAVVLEEDVVYVASGGGYGNGGSVTAIDVSGGEVMWTHAEADSVTGLQLASGTRYARTWDGWIRALSIADWDSTWSCSTGHPIGAITGEDGTLYVGSRDAHLTCWTRTPGTAGKHTNSTAGCDTRCTSATARYSRRIWSAGAPARSTVWNRSAAGTKSAGRHRWDEGGRVYTCAGLTVMCVRAAGTAVLNVIPTVNRGVHAQGNRTMHP